MRGLRRVALCGLACASCTLPAVPLDESLAWSGEPALQAAPPSATKSARRKPFDETLGLRAGGIAFGTFQTEASLGVTGTSVGTTVNLEDDIGLSSQTTSGRVDAYWRPGRHHRIDASWFTLDRESTRIIDRDINWGGEVFPDGTTVRGKLETDILQLRYSWYFLAADDFELGVGLGIYGMNVEASLSGTFLGIEKSFDTPLPLPVVSLQGAWEVLPRLQLVGSAQFFFLELENIGSTEEIGGSIVDVMVGAEYEFVDHFGLGAAYNYFQIRTDVVSDGLEFDFDYGYTAAYLYLFVKV